MAGQNFGPRGPPPPPDHGGGVIDLTNELEGGGGRRQGGQQQRPQQEFRGQQQRMQQMPPQFGRTVQVLNSSQMVSDISPQVMLTESTAREKLTIYEAYTLRKAEPSAEVLQRYEENLATGVRRRSLVSATPRSSRPKPNWQRVTITRDAYDQVAIRTKVKSLDRSSRPVTTKKANLAPNQHIQVTKLVDDKQAQERDPSFVWTLAQLERKEVTNRVTGYKETDSMTLYLKRAPRDHINALQLYMIIHMQSMPQHHQQMQDGRHFDHEMSGGGGGSLGKGNKAGGGLPKGAIGPVGKNGGGGGLKKGGKDQIIEIIDDRELRGGGKSPGKGAFGKSPQKIFGAGKKKKFDVSSDSDSYSSDSDSDASYSTDSSSAPSSSHRRRSGLRGLGGHALRHHEKERGWVTVGGGRDRRTSYPLAPDAPRLRGLSYERTSLGSMGSDPISEAFSAGVVAGSKVAEKGLASSRQTAYPIGSAYSSRLSEDLRNLRLTEGIRDDISLRSGSLYDDELRRDELRRDDLRREDMLRRQDRRMLEAEERLRRDSALLGVSPTSRVPLASDYLPRRSIGSLPLDEGAYTYLRNPFATRRESVRGDGLRERMEFRDCR